MDEIASHSYVLTPGRYVGAEDLEDDGELFEDEGFSPPHPPDFRQG
jgi:type I restriction enzyme M protein